MQHYRAEAGLFIDVAPGVLWLTVAQMTDMEVWYPALITQSDVNATVDPPTRICEMRGGDTLHERILLIDAATRTFVYAIDAHPMAAKDVVGTIRIDPISAGSHVTWDAQFTVSDDLADDTVSMVAGLYRRGLESLAKYHTE